MGGTQPKGSPRGLFWTGRGPFSLPEKMGGAFPPVSGRLRKSIDAAQEIHLPQLQSHLQSRQEIHLRLIIQNAPTDVDQINDLTDQHFVILMFPQKVCFFIGE